MVKTMDKDDVWSRVWPLQWKENVDERLMLLEREIAELKLRQNPRRYNNLVFNTEGAGSG